MKCSCRRGVLNYNKRIPLPRLWIASAAQSHHSIALLKRYEVSTARLLTVSADRTEFCREWQGFCFHHRSSSMSVLLLGWSRDRKNWPNTEPPKYISFPRYIFRGNEIYLEGSKYISMERNIFRSLEIYFVPSNEIISQNSPHVPLGDMYPPYL